MFSPFNALHWNVKRTVHLLARNLFRIWCIQLKCFSCRTISVPCSACRRAEVMTIKLFDLWVDCKRNSFLVSGTTNPFSVGFAEQWRYYSERILVAANQACRQNLWGPEDPRYKNKSVLLNYERFRRSHLVQFKYTRPFLLQYIKALYFLSVIEK